MFLPHLKRSGSLSLANTYQRSAQQMHNAIEHPLDRNPHQPLSRYSTVSHSRFEYASTHTHTHKHIHQGKRVEASRAKTLIAIRYLSSPFLLCTYAGFIALAGTAPILNIETFENDALIHLSNPALGGSRYMR